MYLSYEMIFKTDRTSKGAAIAYLNMFFWVLPRRQIVVGRRFGTLYRFHLQRLVVDCEV